MFRGFRNRFVTGHFCFVFDIITICCGNRSIWIRTVDYYSIISYGRLRGRRPLRNSQARTPSPLSSPHPPAKSVNRAPPFFFPCRYYQYRCKRTQTRDLPIDYDHLRFVSNLCGNPIAVNGKRWRHFFFFCLHRGLRNDKKLDDKHCWLRVRIRTSCLS